ncbi:hypothetical protein [Pandoraea sp. NPDC087047]|uniref:hypothetical protein n=1 Tax=Pandoraea sp. NPDC087047 TaxID=3364390 RepID=UPI0038049CF3
MASKNQRSIRVVGERIVDRPTSEVAERIEELAQELRRATDPLHVRQLAHSIMTLAADIAVTATN